MKTLCVAPTYGLKEATQLRDVARSLFAEKRPSNIPADIFERPYAERDALAAPLYDIADEIESAPGPVEIELVMPEMSPYTLEQSRDIYYLLRTALV